MTHRWLKFWPQDWQRDPALRSCGIASRGLWIELICIMHDGTPYGHLTINGKPATMKQLGTITGAGEKEVTKLLEELEDAGVFSRNDDGVIFSRRMIRDHDRSEEGKRNVNKRGDRSDPSTPPNRGPSSPPNPKANSPPNTQEYRVQESEFKKQKEPPKPPVPGGRAPGSDSDPDFVAFWEAYPRKDDKGHARNAWKTAIRKAEPSQIVAGCRGYKFELNRRFQPLPATWLNGERWLQASEADGMDPTLRAAGVTQEMLDEYLGGQMPGRGHASGAVQKVLGYPPTSEAGKSLSGSEKKIYLNGVKVP